LCGFAPAHLGQGSLLRNALLPAPNVVNSRERYVQYTQKIIKELYKNDFIKIIQNNLTKE